MNGSGGKERHPQIRRELVGQRFGRLLVREEDGQWCDCLCDCGTSCRVKRRNLSHGRHNGVKSCGCLRRDKGREVGLRPKRRDPIIDLTGKRFGKLTALYEKGRDYSGHCWLCVCECKRNVVVQGGKLRYGKMTSCGCDVRNTAKYYRDLSGQRFGRLRVLHEDGKDRFGLRWRCVCDCGNTVSVQSRRLQGGVTRSCGCYRIDIKRAFWTEEHWNRLLAMLPEKGTFYVDDENIG